MVLRFMSKIFCLNFTSPPPHSFIIHAVMGIWCFSGIKHVLIVLPAINYYWICCKYGWIQPYHIAYNIIYIRIIDLTMSASVCLEIYYSCESIKFHWLNKRKVLKDCVFPLFNYVFYWICRYVTSLGNASTFSWYILSIVNILIGFGWKVSLSHILYEESW
jgi:hypothetical protein